MTLSAVDALDTVCKQYKDCQKCARATHGDTCIGEFVRYKYGEKNGDKFCKDDAGSCERNLCECDLQFAKNHVAKKDVFNKDYHLFWGNGWEPKDNCPRATGFRLRDIFDKSHFLNKLLFLSLSFKFYWKFVHNNLRSS